MKAALYVGLFALFLLSQASMILPATASILSAPVVADSNFNELTTMVVGQQVMILTNISSTGTDRSESVLITQIRNEKDQTVFLQQRWTKPALDQIELRHLWRPEEPGTYQIRSFLVSMSCYPDVLTPVSTSTISVSLPDGGQSMVTRDGNLTSAEIGRLTEKEQTIFDEVSDENMEADRIRLEEKEQRIRNLIWTDERIREYQQTVDVFGFDSDFVMDESFCDSATMTILVSRERNTEGDWQTQYVTTLSGRSELKVNVSDGRIDSVVDNPLDNSTAVQAYTQHQKKVIGIALADERVEALFRDRDVEVGIVRDSGVSFNECEECAIVSIYVKEDRLEKGVVVLVDVSNESVVSVRPSLEWITDEPERSLAAVDEGEYVIEVSFHESLGKDNFIKMQSDFDMKVEYLEYVATGNITGGASMVEFDSIQALENELSSRHDVSLLGVTKIIASGEATSLLDFYREMRKNLSHFAAIQVLR